MMIQRVNFHYHLFAAPTALSLTSPSILLSPLPIIFSAKSSNVNTNVQSQNPFVQFAATQFKISSADLERIFEYAPSLHIFQTLEEVENFVKMLKKHGCNQQQIATIMKKQPSLVTVSAKKVLEPKIQFLKDSGIRGENLVKILTKRPNILRHRLEKTLQPSLAFWEGFGLHGKELAALLVQNPRRLRCSSLSPAKMDLMQKIGIDRKSKMFFGVISILACYRMETMEAKMEILQLCGISSKETLELFRVSPTIFNLSKELLQKKMNFIVNNMKLPAYSVVKHPGLLAVSLEKVMKPRFLVWQKIKSIGLENVPVPKLSSVLTVSQQYFVSKIIERHPESAILYDIYEKAIVDASNATKASGKEH